MQMGIDCCRSQYDYCDPRFRAKYTLQISYQRAGLFAYHVATLIRWFRFLFKPVPAHFPNFFLRMF